MENLVLEKIKSFADNAHGEQRRKYSHERYINHPIRVMVNCMKHTKDEVVLAAALLHDVLEDTPVTTGELADFLEQTMTNDQTAAKTVKLVEELTDVYTKKDYPYLNRRKRKWLEVVRLSEVSAEAQTVKYADIIDNSINISENDPDFALVYLLEGKKLLQHMDRGIPELRHEAMRVNERSLRQLDSV